MPRGIYIRGDPVARFWSNVDKSATTLSSPFVTTPCWWWTACTRKGYGMFRWEGRQRGAHIVAHILENGPISAGRQVNHECDNPLCVRPEHLHLGGPSSNSAEMVTRGRQASGDRHGWYTRPESRPRGDRNGRRTHPEMTARGERAGGVKLTEADVLAIRVAAGTHREIADRFGVSRAQVGNIKRGEAWVYLLNRAVEPHTLE